MTSNKSSRCKSETVFRELVDMYTRLERNPESDKLRRRVLKALLRHEDPKRGLDFVLEALANDRREGNDDPIAEDCVVMLLPLWEEQALFERARDIALSPGNPKIRTLLHRSLLRHVNDLGPCDPRGIHRRRSLGELARRAGVSN